LTGDNVHDLITRPSDGYSAWNIGWVGQNDGERVAVEALGGLPVLRQVHREEPAAVVRTPLAGPFAQADALPAVAGFTVGTGGRIFIGNAVVITGPDVIFVDAPAASRATDRLLAF
jgi:hypothetical protein